MLRALALRLGSAAGVIIGVSALVFVLTHVIPGDPVEVMLGERASGADRAALAAAHGLDRPLRQQLVDYYAGLLRLDLGTSLHQDRAVTTLLAERLPATLELTAAALAVAVLLALPLGLLGALRPGSAADHAASGFSLLGLSVPNFWLGPLLILAFSLQAGWFPVSGREGPASLVLPALTLGTALAAILTRMLRASLLEVLGQDHLRTARAKGLSPRRVIGVHALRAAALPLLTVLGLQLGGLLGGAVITETVFAWPGLGTLTIEAIQRRDYPVIQGCVLLITVTFVVVNLLTDWAYVLADPRIRGAAA